MSFLDSSLGQKSKKLIIYEFFGLAPNRWLFCKSVAESLRAWPFSKVYPGRGGNGGIPAEGAFPSWVKCGGRIFTRETFSCGSDPPQKRGRNRVPKPSG